MMIRALAAARPSLVRLGVRQPSWTRLAKPELLGPDAPRWDEYNRPTGRTILETAAAPAFYRVRGWSEAGLDPLQPGYSRFAPGSSIFTSEAEVDAALDAVAARARVLGKPDDVPANYKPGFHIQRELAEARLAQGIAVQRGRPWHAHLGFLGDPGDDQLPARWSGLMDQLVRWCFDAAPPDLVQMYAFQADRTDTNPGYPFPVAGAANRAVAAGTSAPTLSLMRERGSVAGGALGWEGAANLAFILSYRSGPASKAFNAWMPESTGATTAAQAHWKVDSGWPRSRHVFMAPAGAILRLRGLRARLYAGCLMLPGLNHSAERLGNVPTSAEIGRAAASDPTLFAYEGDISRYDQSVRKPHQAAFAIAVRKLPGGTLIDAADIWQFLEGAPVITPPWRLGAEGFAVVGSNGGIHSGLKTTSLTGIFYALTTALYAMGRYFADPLAAWLEGKFKMLNLGDDILLYLPFPLDTKAWKDDWAECGFEAKILAGGVFLMRLQHPDGADNLTSRIIQTTLFPEEEYVGETGIVEAAIAFAARTERASAVDDPMAVACLLHAKFIRDAANAYRCKSVAALRVAVVAHYGEKIAAYLRQQAEASRPAALIISAATEAAFRPSAAAVARFLSANYPGWESIMAPVTAIKAAGQLAALECSALSLTDYAALVNAYGTELSSGRKPRSGRFAHLPVPNLRALLDLEWRQSQLELRAGKHKR